MLNDIVEWIDVMKASAASRDESRIALLGMRLALFEGQQAEENTARDAVRLRNYRAAITILDAELKQVETTNGR